MEAAHGLIAIRGNKNSSFYRSIRILRLTANGVAPDVERIAYIIKNEETGCAGLRSVNITCRNSRLTIVGCTHDTSQRGVLLWLAWLLLCTTAGIDGTTVVLYGLTIWLLIRLLILLLWILLLLILLLWILLLICIRQSVLLLCRCRLYRPCSIHWCCLLAETHHHLEPTVRTLDDFLGYVELVLDIKLRLTLWTIYSNYFHICCFLILITYDYQEMTGMLLSNLPHMTGCCLSLEIFLTPLLTKLKSSRAVMVRSRLASAPPRRPRCR